MNAKGRRDFKGLQGSNQASYQTESNFCVKSVPRAKDQSQGQQASAIAAEALEGGTKLRGAFIFCQRDFFLPFG